MASAGGLTRRRGGGRAAGADDNDDSRVSSPISRNGSALDHRGPETSFTSGENGHKIVFDPRDLSETEERSKQPKLTLMEDILLLGLKDKQVGFSCLFSPYLRPCLKTRKLRMRQLLTAGNSSCYRVIYRSGTKTSPTPCEDALSLSWRSAVG